MSRRPYRNAVAASAVMVACAAGCIGSAITNGGGKGNKGDMAAPIPDMAMDPKLVFTASIQSLMVMDCGQCHAQPNGSFPPFLVAQQGSDVYTTFTAWPNMVGATPATSLILAKGTHEGPSYHDAVAGSDLAKHAALIADWITLYNAAGGKLSGSTDMAVTPKLDPISITSGIMSTISLAPLGAAYAGMTITFTPKVTGSIINVSDITLTGTATAGLQVTGTVIALYAADLSTADNIDLDFYPGTYTAYPGTPAVLGSSLRPYTAGEKLGFSFETIAPSMGMPDMGGAVGMCKDVAGFTAFKPFITGGMDNGNPLSKDCTSCHNSGNGGFSTNGFKAAADNTTPCAQTLLNVNVATPAMSSIYTAISGNGAHTGGKLTAQEQTDFLNSLTTWLANEK
ncbi:MAG: hypothetical protein ABI321_15970 [Polyangia bacterium]